MAKMIVYGEEARKSLQKGIDQLANTCLLYTSWPGSTTMAIQMRLSEALCIFASVSYTHLLWTKVTS